MIDSISRLTSMTVAPAGVGAAAPPQVATRATPSADFADVLAEVSGNAMSTLKAGEAAAIGGIEGKASVQQVVEAIMSAEQTLQTALAIRDKVVSAYQEISRMAV